MRGWIAHHVALVVLSAVGASVELAVLLVKEVVR